MAPLSSTTYQLAAKGPGSATTADVQITVTIPPLTEANILDLLRNEVPKPRIVQLVTERGIAFELTASVEQRLRSAGADDMVIEAVKKAHHWSYGAVFFCRAACSGLDAELLSRLAGKS